MRVSCRRKIPTRAVLVPGQGTEATDILTVMEGTILDREGSTGLVEIMGRRCMDGSRELTGGDLRDLRRRFVSFLICME